MSKNKKSLLEIAYRLCGREPEEHIPSYSFEESQKRLNLLAKEGGNSYITDDAYVSPILANLINDINHYPLPPKLIAYYDGVRCNIGEGPDGEGEYRKTIKEEDSKVTFVFHDHFLEYIKTLECDYRGRQEKYANAIWAKENLPSGKYEELRKNFNFISIEDPDFSYPHLDPILELWNKNPFSWEEQPEPKKSIKQTSKESMKKKRQNPMYVDIEDHLKRKLRRMDIGKNLYRVIGKLLTYARKNEYIKIMGTEPKFYKMTFSDGEYTDFLTTVAFRNIIDYDQYTQELKKANNNKIIFIKEENNETIITIAV